jgi:hypothetical protein
LSSQKPVPLILCKPEGVGAFLNFGSRTYRAAPGCLAENSAAYAPLVTADYHAWLLKPAKNKKFLDSQELHAAMRELAVQIRVSDNGGRPRIAHSNRVGIVDGLMEAPAIGLPREAADICMPSHNEYYNLLGCDGAVSSRARPQQQSQESGCLS